MKKIIILLTSSLVVLLTSCGPYQTSSGGGFWGGLSSLVDYGISEWEKTMPADSYDHTLIDAWKSGTGGKALVVSEVATDVIGGISGKDVSALKDRIHNAAHNLTQNEIFTQNEVNNWTGALFTLGDEFIDEYNTQKFNETVKRLTDPNASGYDEEEALRVKSVDYDNKKIIWKSSTEYIYDLIDFRRTKNKDWISSNIGPACNMTLQEYENLPDEVRQQADLKILAYERSKKSAPEPDRQIEQDSELEIQPSSSDSIMEITSLIDAIVLSGYNINSYTLSTIQKDALDDLVDMMKNAPTLQILISGHTCILGSENVNYNVGRKRAETAKEYLVGRGIEDERINIESLGSSNPADDNSTSQGRKHNRRITFKIINK